MAVPNHLSDQQKQRIRKIYVRGEISMETLAKRFDVSSHTIYKVLKGVPRQHVARS